MPGFVVDASALLCVVLGEPEAQQMVERLAEGEGERRVVNAATLLEAAVAAERRGGLEARDRLDRVVTKLAPEVVPFDEAHLGWAREAYRRFGRGRHPAALNLGDCIAYATARQADLPLLFKGDDFARTDIERA